MTTTLRRLTLAILLLTSTTLLADGVDIKLATLAPPGTTWFKALADMSASWKRDTEGRVSVTIFPGQAEKATLQKMRPAIDAYQASFMTSGGLADLDDAFDVFGIPFFFENDKEQQAVQSALAPILAQRLEAKGYHLVCWGTGGWVQIFSKNKITSLADLKKAKLYADKDDPKMLAWYKNNGFNVVPLQALDIQSQLKFGGMIDTAPHPPYLASISQIYRDAKYMINLHILPLTGALVVTKGAWSKISAADQAKITAAAQATEAEIRTNAPKLDTDSIASMKQRGLEVIDFDAKAMADLRAEATKLGATMRGNMVPAEIYDAALKARGR